ncbi:MAG: serine/threonine protein kinase, partial [Planctomycetaceae bacterium]
MTEPNATAKRRMGPFQLEKQLGIGGMGIVYLAIYAETGRNVAVKVLSPQMTANATLVRRFEREMEILKKLRHPHIVRYYGGGKSGGQHYYAMELMEAGSLEEVLRRKGQLSWEQTIDCAMHISKALEHAHNHGIIHRDLKPANLFLSKEGRLKLGDFGIARDSDATALTAAGKTVGTYAYMAPEQISGRAAISGKTDLYALGCVMFEMLTGRTPFLGETAAEMLMKHLSEAPPRVREFTVNCPVWLESLVMRLLEKNPEDRYYDALAVQVA